MAQDKDQKTLNVPPLRFPGFTDEWKEYSIDEIANIYGRIGFRGYTSADLVEKGNGAISLSPSNITNNQLYTDKDNTYISFYKYEESPEIKIFVGDVIFVKTGSTVGKVAYVDYLKCEATLNPQLVVFKDIKCDNYLFSQILATNKIQQRVSKITVGGAVPTLSQTELGKVRLFLPGNQEQNKIATLLSLIEKRIYAQNKIIEDLKKLKSAIRKKLFTNLKNLPTEYTEIGELLNYEQPSEYIVASDEYISDITKTPVLTANKGFILGYTEEQFGVYSKGECIIFDDFTMDVKYVSFPFKVKSSAIKILTAKPNVNLRFMFEYLQSMDLKSEEHKRHYISEIAMLVVAIPMIEIQNRIACIIDSIDRKLTIEQQVAKEYELEKLYLLSNMFI